MPYSMAVFLSGYAEAVELMSVAAIYTEVQGHCHRHAAQHSSCASAPQGLLG